MINAEHKLSLTRQAQLLELSRASLYYTPVAVSDADLRLMKRIDGCIWSCRSPVAACCAT